MTKQDITQALEQIAQERIRALEQRNITRLIELGLVEKLLLQERIELLVKGQQQQDLNEKAG